jgi:hypothetical protein
VYDCSHGAQGQARLLFTYGAQSARSASIIPQQRVQTKWDTTSAARHPCERMCPIVTGAKVSRDLMPMIVPNPPQPTASPQARSGS